jgi:hypothetical protein
MNRSLVYARAAPGGVEALCDCGMTTVLILDVEPGWVGTIEQAFTCDGCTSVHWFTITIPTAQTSDQSTKDTP